MADNTRITGPVTVQQDSRERVAYDLMVKIGNHESEDERNKRAYWLKLYAQCYSVCTGSPAEHALTLK